MPNDDGLKDYLVDDSTPIKEGQVTDWLYELLDAREKIAAIRYGMKFYIERNIELIQEAKDAKSNLEHWVTQAGMWEAKARSNKENTEKK